MIDVATFNIEKFKIFAIAFCIISAILFLIPIFTFAVNFVKRHKKIGAKRKTFDSSLVLCTICLALSMFCLQFLSEFYVAFTAAKAIFESSNISEKLLVWEIFANSFDHTLKSFGADDNFLLGMEGFKALLSEVFSASKFVIYIYSVIASFMALAAPITGATIIFEILSNFFPKVKFGFLKCISKREKYYFSELNERSLALAKSITKDDPLHSPIIIFTDVYANKTQENTTELLADAKNIGAICLREDISHIHKGGRGTKKFFLIDDNEVKNLQTLTNLADDFNTKYVKDSEIYLFCQNNIYADIEQKVGNKLKAVNSNILPVRCYRNLITNMLEKTPLFEPIVHKRSKNLDDKLNLNVTILGIGDIGTEMFLTTYWMGQMLNCKLNINIISNETEEQFWGKIDSINPEIRRTIQLVNGNKDELLRVYPAEKDVNGNIIYKESDFADTYCDVRYYSCNTESEEFKKLLSGESTYSLGSKKINPILDSHYILVSLGSDHMNLSIANTLKKRIGSYHIDNAKKGNPNEKTIINYVIYNADLSKTLNSEKYVYSFSNTPDIYMQAVGGIENVYCEENIFMTRYTEASKASEENYNEKENKTSDIHPLADEYSLWANLAQCMHFKYKVFSIGYLKTSLFDETDEEKYKEKLSVECKNYIDKFRKDVTKNGKRKPSPEEQLLHRLERRRWCATTRVNGFQHTDNYEFYYRHTGSHKNNSLKLHPCLVESKDNDSAFILDDNGKFLPISLTEYTNPDQLDIVTKKVYLIKDAIKKEKALIKTFKKVLNVEKDIDDEISQLTASDKEAIVKELRNHYFTIDIEDISNSITIRKLAEKATIISTDEIVLIALRKILNNPSLDMNDSLPEIEENVKKEISNELKVIGYEIKIGNIKAGVTINELAKQLIGLEKGFKVNDFPNNKYLDYVLTYLNGDKNKKNRK